MEAFIKLLADGTLLVIMVAGAIILARGVPMSRWREVVPYALMAGLTSLLIGKLMSLVYQPAIARPFIEHGVSPGAAYIDNPGFPSDHALLATVVFLAVFCLTRYRKLAIVLGLAVVAMSLARVVALVHTPLDVIGGILAGLSGGLWYYVLTKNKER